ncbi:helix-turn-helix transcriptional regulator [Methylosinus sporium]|uniref:helix-turn-helix transcriptional regulator n=1 Tax=Methylosinus sporium TaxID=428 RepID=UPI00133049B9|nr:LuxR family transcriptional regulator [Methylosinus sporium]
MRRDIFCQMEKIGSLKSVDEFFEYLDSTGIIRHATFHMISCANNALAIPYIKTTYPSEWVSFYFLNGLMKSDPIIRVARESDTPFFWSEIVMTSMEKSMMKRAMDFHLGSDGFTVPTADIGPYRGLFSICPEVNCASYFSDYISLRRVEINKIAYTLHNIARSEIDPYGSYAADLSKREAECLRYIAIGKTYTEMAGILDISEHTVRSYCRAIRLKLNSVTLAQAVAKACAMGVI